MLSKLIVGCGYLGRRVAQQWLQAGETVLATTRSQDRATEFSAQGIHPLVCDVTNVASLTAAFGNLPGSDVRAWETDALAKPITELPQIGTVLFAVGFDRRSGKQIDEVYVDGFKNLLQVLPSSVRKVIYISSTGVYGSTDGGTVDENTPCHPTTPGGIACLAAEKLLQARRVSLQTSILRLAGIYGPNRVPSLKLLQDGTPIPCDEASFLNLIHVDDACQVVIAADKHDSPPECLVVADGHPVKRRDFYSFAAELLGVQATFGPIDPNSPRGVRARTSKQCENRLMLEALSLRLRHPDYRSGLHEILSSSP